MHNVFADWAVDLESRDVGLVRKMSLGGEAMRRHDPWVLGVRVLRADVVDDAGVGVLPLRERYGEASSRDRRVLVARHSSAVETLWTMNVIDRIRRFVHLYFAFIRMIRFGRSPSRSI